MLGSMLSRRLFLQSEGTKFNNCTLLQITHFSRHETLLIKYGGLVRVLTVTFQISGSLQVMTGVSVLIFIATGGNLTTQRVFTTLSLVSALNSRSGINLVVSFFYLYEVMVALSRIEVCVCASSFAIVMSIFVQEFLLLEEINPVKCTSSKNSECMEFDVMN